MTDKIISITVADYGVISISDDNILSITKVDTLIKETYYTKDESSTYRSDYKVVNKQNRCIVFNGDFVSAVEYSQ